MTTQSTEVQGKYGTDSLIYDTKSKQFTMCVLNGPMGAELYFNGQASSLMEAKKQAEAWLETNEIKAKPQY